MIDEDDGVLDRILNGTAIPKSVVETIMCVCVHLEPLYIRTEHGFIIPDHILVLV